MTIQPARGRDIVPAILDAELVDDDTPTPARRGPVHLITTLRTDDRPPARAARTGLAVAITTAQGFESWAKRGWDGASFGVYRRQIRAAEAADDREALAEWLDRRERAAQARHKAWMDMPALAVGLAKAAVGTLAGLVALLIVLGVFVQLSGAGRFVDIILGALDVLRWIFVAVSLAWTPLMIAAPFLLVVAAWREGKRRGAAPAWLVTTAEATDLVIDETTIARALDALRIAQVSQYLKAGTPLQFLTPCRVDGRGTHAVMRLPVGVPAERIARRRADFATGLHRLAKEVWPTTGAEEGILDVWIADKGALAEGAGPYPLLEDGVTDFFKGFPAGKTLRGTPVTAPMMGRNTIVGGMPEQGKSSAARCEVAGAALEPTVEIRIWVPDANFDFEHFRPRCSRYVMGAEQADIERILDDLRELHAEVQIRGQLLVRYEIAEVNRQYASKNVGLHPIVALLEEAHVAMQHPEHGDEISRLVTEIVRLGRKRAIHFIVSTQAPTANSVPRDVTRNCSNGIAFAVGDHVANDALLGQGAYAGGHRATELIPGTDRGTALVKGFSGQRAEIVQFYFIHVDQVPALIERSMDAIARAGRSVPGTGPSAASLMVERDLLEDLDAVLGDAPVPVADVPALLRDHAPGHAPYRQLTGVSLRKRLAAECRIKVPSTGNRFPLDPLAVRQALADRATADLDDE